MMQHHIVSARLPCCPVGTWQQGQALVECLVAMIGLLGLWAAIHWLSQYQDLALSATHASRHAAFLAAREMPGGVPVSSVEPYFSGDAHRWVDRRATRLMSDNDSVQLEFENRTRLSAAAQPGGASAIPRTLRREWELEDEGLLRARVALSFREQPVVAHPPERTGFRSHLDVFSSSYPGLSRTISVLTGTGHSRSDRAVQARVGASDLAWSSAHSASAMAAGSVSLLAAGVDDAWGRSLPGTDWLHPWAAHVPPHLLVPYEGDVYAGN
jgi:hypothetical protein